MRAWRCANQRGDSEGCEVSARSGRERRRAKLAASKLDQSAADFLSSRDRAIRNAAILQISTAVGTGPLYLLPRLGAAQQYLYVRATCIRCSAQPVVSSVGSRAAYCEHHWLELWIAGT